MGVASKGANISNGSLDGRLAYLWAHLIAVIQLTSHLRGSWQKADT